MTFDAYHKWLGIPPHEQPPNHYRLLGLAPFEADPDVIDVATEQRVAFLHQCATGTHVEESQKLLNELAAARLCLLHVKQKQAYDESLRALAVASTPATEAFQNSDSAPDARTPAARAFRGPSDSRKWAWMAAIVATVVATAVTASLLWSLKPASEPVSSGQEKPRSEDGSPPSPVSAPAADPSEDRLILATIPEQTVSVGEALGVWVSAKSLHNRPLILSFAFDRDAPSGASVDRESGRFWWIPNGEHAGKTFSMAVRITADDNKQIQAEVAQFTVTVKSAAVPPLATPSASSPGIPVTTSNKPSPAKSAPQTKNAPQTPPSPPKPVRVTLQALAAVSLKSGDRQTITVRATRENSDAEIRLQLQQLPAGVNAAPATIPRGANQVNVELVADAAARKGRSDVQIVATMGAATHTESFALTVTRRPPRETVFDDDFKVPGKSKLWTGSAGTHSARIEKGRYVIQILPGKEAETQRVVGPSLSDFEFNAKIRIAGSNPSGTAAFAIIFRDHPPQAQQTSRLAWFINAKGNSTFIRQTIDPPAAGGIVKTAQEFLPWTALESYTADWNRIRVKAVGSKVELEINGDKRKIEVGGPNYKSNVMDVWFSIIKYADEDSCTLEIDDIKVVRINPP